jgi:hypothetical protein
MKIYSANISGSLSVTGSVNIVTAPGTPIQGTIATASYISPTFISASAASFGFGTGGGGPESDPIFAAWSASAASQFAGTASFTRTALTASLSITSVTASYAATASVVLDKSFYSAGIISGSGWSQPVMDGTITVPNAQVALYATTDFTGPLTVYNITGTTISTLANNDTNYIYVDYNAGSPQYAVTQDFEVIDHSSKVLHLIVYRASNFVHVLEFGNQGAGLSNKINDRFITVDRFARESGLELILDTTNGYVTASAGVAWNGAYRQTLAQINSGDDVFFRSYHSASVWVYSTSANKINNSIYDTGITTASISPGKYLTNWYYRGQEVNDHIYEVISTDEYDSVAEAQLATQPNLPELVSSHAFLMGRIIVPSGSYNGLIESAYDIAFLPSAVTSHNDLTGIQGGTTNQYYHLTQAQYNIVSSGTSSWAENSVTASYISPTFISASAAASGFGSGGAVTGVTSIIAGDGISVNQSTGAVTITNTGGGGGGTNLGLVYAVSLGYLMP